jgi:hypothetical protein
VWLFSPSQSNNTGVSPTYAKVRKVLVPIREDEKHMHHVEIFSKIRQVNTSLSTLLSYQSMSPLIQNDKTAPGDAAFIVCVCVCLCVCLLGLVKSRRRFYSIFWWLEYDPLMFVLAIRGCLSYRRGALRPSMLALEPEPYRWKRGMSTVECTTFWCCWTGQ